MQLNPIQLELLKLFSFQSITDQDLLAVKKMLTRYLADKLSQEADKIWDERNYTQELMDEWLKDDE